MYVIRSSQIRETLMTTVSNLTLGQTINFANLYKLSRIHLENMNGNKKPKWNAARNESEVTHIETKDPHRGRQP